eukprot:619508_1
MAYTVEGPGANNPQENDNDSHSDKSGHDLGRNRIWSAEIQIVDRLHSTPDPGVIRNPVHENILEVQQWLNSEVGLSQYFDALIQNGYESWRLFKIYAIGPN